MLTPGQRLRLPLADLKGEHPLLAAYPAWAQDNDHLLALAQDIRERVTRGEEPLIEALKLTPAGLLADGRNRRNGARLAQVPEVMCEVVAESAVPGLVRASLLHRRHQTKGQLAYLCVPLFEAEFKAAEERRAWASPTLPHPMRKGPERVRTLAECAAEIGVSERVLQQAKELRDLFAEYPEVRLLGTGAEQEETTFQGYYEPRLLREEDPEAPQTRAMSLGGALAGIKQVLAIKVRGKHGGGRPDTELEQLTLFREVIKSARTRFAYWQEWGEETQAEALRDLPPFVEATPTEVLARLIKLGHAELKRREAQPE